MTLLGEFTSS